MDDISIQIVLTADDGFSGAYTSKDQIQRMVDWANDVFSPASIRFGFDPNSIVTIKDRLINKDSTLPPGVDFHNLSEVQHVVFRGTNNRVYELWAGASWSLVDLTSQVGGIEAGGDPACYTTAFDSVKHVVFRGRDNHVYELWAGDTWGANDLTAAVGGIEADGDPVAYTTGLGAVQHVVFRGRDNHVYELWAGDTWGANDLTAAVGGIEAGGDPVAYVTEGDVQHVVFRGRDNHVYELWAGDTWGANDLTAAVGGIEADGDPVAYTTNLGSVQHVVFRGRDDHIYELWAGDTWGANDLTAATGTLDAVGNPAAYITDDYNNGTPDVQHVVFRGKDGRLHELFAGDTWGEGLLRDAPVPNAAGDPVAYTTNSKQTQHVVFRDDRNHLHEVYAGDSWSPNNLTQRTGAPEAMGTPAAFVDGMFGAEIHANERQLAAEKYPGRLVIYVSHGELTRDFNFSNSIANYVVMLPGENDLAHEIGHFFHLGHTHGPYPSEELRAQGGKALTQWASEQIRNYVDVQGHPADQGASVFDGDQGFVNDTPPDPTPEVWAATHSGDLCSTDRLFTVDVPLSSGNRTYSWEPARWNIMSYFDKRCPQFNNARHLSDQQVGRLRAALEHGNRKYLL